MKKRLSVILTICSFEMIMLPFKSFMYKPTGKFFIADSYNLIFRLAIANCTACADSVVVNPITINANEDVHNISSYYYVQIGCIFTTWVIVNWLIYMLNYDSKGLNKSSKSMQFCFASKSNSLT